MKTMQSKNISWEKLILVFALTITALSGVAYQIMLVYSVDIPWFVWLGLVLLSALIALGSIYIPRQPGQ